MEVKNGIIIDGVLHEAAYGYIRCDLCPIYEKCAEVDCAVCMADLFSCGSFINRGKVTDIKIEKEE
jgi:hypothetical protein